MGATSKIEWTDATWNPIRARVFEIQGDGSGKERIGWHCEHVSEGCRNCYAEGINIRLGTGLEFKPGNLFRPAREGYNNGEAKIFLDEKMLLAPLRWKTPKMIFVCSMTDLFADFVTGDMIDRVFAVMALCPQHTFQVLTKRSARMRTYFNGPYPSGDGVYARIADATFSIAPEGRLQPGAILAERPVGPILGDGTPEFGYRRFVPVKGLPNVWLGVSVEDQENANARIPDLLATPAAIRFLSAEPLIGPIDLTSIREQLEGESFQIFNALDHPDTLNKGECRQGLDWIIAGGESGHKARPAHPDWFRVLRDQCAAAGVPFFFKQWGEWLPGEANRGQLDARPMHSYRRVDNHTYEWPPGNYRRENFGCHPDRFSGDWTTMRVGKKRAGRLLDGVEHNAMPGGPP